MAIKAVAGALAFALCAAAQAAPSTFGTVVANGLLCRDQISNAFFYDYLKSYFGNPYKREGGAWWFRAQDAQLWGMEVVELIVSDDSYPYSFIGAIVDTAPDKLEEAIRQHDGIRFAQVGGTAAYPIREGNAGSRIVYVNNRAKIYCAKFKSLPPALR
jgi:hypothetical protein